MVKFQHVIDHIPYPFCQNCLHCTVIRKRGLIHASSEILILEPNISNTVLLDVNISAVPYLDCSNDYFVNKVPICSSKAECLTLNINQ